MILFLLLSQNIVTVCLIYVELVRFANLDNSVGAALTCLFSRFADHREQAESRLLLTHLYLLIGLGLPTNLTFIILGGGFPDGEFAIFAYSGVVFLGVTDTVAALSGKKFGTQHWRANAHKKTVQGTTYAILATLIFFYVFCAHVYDPMCTMFGIVGFATLIAAVTEGVTSQFDNLVCPLVYFISLLQLYDYFISISAPVKTNS